MEEFRSNLREVQLRIEGGDHGDGSLKIVNTLYSWFTDNIADFSSYDREKYGRLFEKLFRTTRDGSLNEEVQFRFRVTPRFKGDQPASSEMATSIDPQSTVKQSYKVQGEAIRLDLVKGGNNVNSLDGLHRCVVTTPETTPHPTIKNGSISIGFCDDSVFVVTVPFDNGSIFVTDCKRCVLLFKIPLGDAVQIRLHNLEECKIQIDDNGLEDTTKTQTIVIEECAKCSFHAKNPELFSIRNFSAFRLASVSSTEKTSWMPLLPTYNHDPKHLAQYIADR